MLEKMCDLQQGGRYALYSSNKEIEHIKMCDKNTYEEKHSKKCVRKGRGSRVRLANCH
jgi:hypothetical protein